MKAVQVVLPQITQEQVNNPPQSATVFLDSSDGLIKAKLADGTVVLLSNSEPLVESVNGQTGIVELSLNDIEDVDTTDVEVDDVLTFDGDDWIAAPSGGGGSPVNFQDIFNPTHTGGQTVGIAFSMIGKTVTMQSQFCNFTGDGEFVTISSAVPLEMRPAFGMDYRIIGKDNGSFQEIMCSVDTDGTIYLSAGFSTSGFTDDAGWREFTITWLADTPNPS